MFTLLSHYQNPAPRPSGPRPTRRSAWALVACAALLGACELGEEIDGSGSAREETREVSEARRVSVHAEGLLVLTQGNDASLRIVADDNIVSLLNADMERGVLVLGPEDGVDLDPETPIVYHLTLPNIDDVEASGATRVEIGPLASPRFSLRTSGASHAEVESLEAEQVVMESSGSSSIEASFESLRADVTLSGASRIVLRGEVDDQELSASGASEYLAMGLRSHRAIARASGSSSVSIFADESIHVEGSGASNVRYQGGGTLSRSLSGAASVDAD